MREIKFRAWDLDNQRMVYDIILSSDINILNISYIANHWNYVFQQFVERKDNKGTEVYEGDIIECEYYEGLPTTENIDLVWRGVVEWSSDSCFHVVRKTGDGKGGYYAIRFGGSAVKRWEVIGNIYENPELIKEK